jgi:hypothetical protein
VAFLISEDGVDAPPGYQYMDCHLVFDVKFDGFRFKSRMVAGGHMVDAPSFLTYVSVVLRETVRIALTIDALHDFDVKVADVENAYLTAPTMEKVWNVCGPEFGPDQGKKAMTRPEDDFQYYAYVLIYVDDILAIGHDSMAQLNKIDQYFKMKKGSIGDPDIYLGSRLRRVVLPYGVESWLISPTKYVAESVKNVERCPSVSVGLYQLTNWQSA